MKADEGTIEALAELLRQHEATEDLRDIARAVLRLLDGAVIDTCYGCGHPIADCVAGWEAPDAGGCSGNWPGRDELVEWRLRAKAAEMRVERLKRRHELRELLSAFLDAAVLPGHVVTDEDWEQACLLCGRWCTPFVPRPEGAGCDDG
jgi:hypothetical protein